MLVDLAAEIVQGEGLRWGLVLTVFLAGLRHGFDLDHIAAITDITSSQSDDRRALRLATFYAAGHALVLALLGVVAVLFGARIPPAADELIGRVIGATLVLLGAYVIYSLVVFRRDFRIRSRWMMAFAGVRRTLAWLRRAPVEQIEIVHAHEHRHGSAHDHQHGPDGPFAPAREGSLTLTATHTHTHKHVVVAPADPFTEYGVATSFGVGLIHGIGAETPTQMLLFATAAGLAGRVGGAVVLFAFVVGLFFGNTILAVASTAGFAGGKKAPRFYMLLAGFTAFLSMYVGALYLLGRHHLLFSFLGP